REAASGNTRKQLAHTALRRADAVLLHDLAVAVQNAISALLVSQVQPNGQLGLTIAALLALLLPLRTLADDNVLHGRSPLHLECVCIGSLTHPTGARPSHPIFHERAWSCQPQIAFGRWS